MGCLDLSDQTVEAPETIVARIKRALPYVAPADVILAPARLLRAELGSR